MVLNVTPTPLTRHAYSHRRIPAYAAFDPNDPSQLIVIGDYCNTDRNVDGQPDFWHGDGGGGGGLINYIAQYDVDCDNPTCFAPAPHVAPIPIAGNTIGLLNVWAVHPNESAYVYNTMLEMDFPVDANLSQRSEENQFSCCAGLSGYVQHHLRRTGLRQCCSGEWPRKRSRYEFLYVGKQYHGLKARSCAVGDPD